MTRHKLPATVLYGLLIGIGEGPERALTSLYANERERAPRLAGIISPRGSVRFLPGCSSARSGITGMPAARFYSQGTVVAERAAAALLEFPAPAGLRG